MSCLSAFLNTIIFVGHFHQLYHMVVLAQLWPALRTLRLDYVYIYTYICIYIYTYIHCIYIYNIHTCILHTCTYIHRKFNYCNLLVSRHIIHGFCFCELDCLVDDAAKRQFHSWDNHRLPTSCRTRGLRLPGLLTMEGAITYRTCTWGRWSKKSVAYWTIAVGVVISSYTQTYYRG